MTPTDTAYAELQKAFDHFNRELFEGTLPACLITMQREKRTYGYFSHARWTDRENQKTDEIAMNPAYFAALPLVEIMQTLVHEMTHSWQQHFGKPGRGRYHNAEWARKMESIGLMPSSTGQPGGKKVGDCMADYPIKDGRFMRALESLLTTKFQITWYDRFPTTKMLQAGQQSHGLSLELPEGAEAIGAALVELPPVVETSKPEGKSNRIKYSCGCGGDVRGDDSKKKSKANNVWGKPGLNMTCNVCKVKFEPNV